MTRARDLAAFVSNADGDIKFDTDTLFIDSSANRVGIGTDTPSEQINLVGSSGTSKIRFDGDSSNLQNNFIGITGYDDLIIASDEANSGSASTIQFKVDGSERMRINSDGRVGIGTTSPDSAYKMTIESTASEAGIRVQGDSARIACFENGSSTIGAGPNFYMQNVSGGTYAATMQMGASAEILFLQYPNSGAWNERLRIQSGGGISFNGDTAAANALDDYEEATWTPDLGSSIASLDEFGSYHKIGRVVFIEGSITVGSNTNGGHMKIINFPFTMASGTSPRGGFAVRYSNYGDFFTLHMDAGNNTCGLYSKTGNVLTYQQMSGKRVDFFGFYHEA